MTSKNEVVEKELAAAVERVYKKYGTNLKAFFDDVNKELAEKRKRPVDITDRTTLELRTSADPEGFFILVVKVDGEHVFGLWCDDIKVYPGKPPMFSFEYKGFGIAGISAREIRVEKRFKNRIPPATLKALENYVKELEE